MLSGLKMDALSLKRQPTDAKSVVSVSSEERAWNAVRELCRKRLEPQDFEAISGLASIEDLLEYLNSLRLRYEETERSFQLARLDAFYYQMRSLHTTLDVLIHIKPEILAPLWGSIKLCIDLVHTTDQVFQLIVEMFDEIQRTLPRISLYVERHDQAPALLEPAQELYSLIAEFTCQVITYFRRNPLKNLLVATWKPFKPELEKTIFKIREKSRQIELEAHTLSLQQNASRHEEILKLLASKDIRARATLPCHHIPMARNPNLSGREDYLGLIRTHLITESDKQRTFALHGLGGVGKTQISIEYVYRHLHDYDAILWLSADTVIKMSQDIRSVTEKLGLIKPNSEENDQQCASRLREWLQETEAKWLIVFDNADDLRVLQVLWPTSERARGHILLTSRDPASARYPNNSKTTKGSQVSPLTFDEGAELLLKIINSMRQDDHGIDAVHDVSVKALALDLVTQFGGLPLAINQIANYMLDADCDLEQFAEIYADFHNRRDLLDESPPGTNVVYPHSLATVWRISMTRIRDANVNAYHMLQLLSFYDPDGVPEGLLDGSAKLRPGETLPAVKYLENKIQYLKARTPLLQQSMISNNKTQRSLAMHRLVSAITAKSLSTESRQERFDEALELIWRVFPQLTEKKASLNEEWPRCRLYTPQVMALEKSFRESEEPLLPRAKFATVLSNAAWFLFENGLPGQAMEILPTARNVGEATIKGNEFAVKTIYRALGGVHLDINKADLALQEWTRQMEIEKETGSELAVAHGLGNMALAELAIGSLADSRRHLSEATAIRAKYPGQAESYRALTLDVTGILDGLEGKYESAIENIKAAIKLYDAELGVGNYLTAYSNYELGNVYEFMGRMEEAFHLHSLALSIRRDTIGQTYHTAGSLHKVAWHLYKRKDFRGAETLVEEALTIFSSAYEGRGAIGRSTYLQSKVLDALDRPEDARKAKALAEEIRHELLGIPAGQDDHMESYDVLVGFQDR